jgi:hypothetical protein
MLIIESSPSMTTGMAKRIRVSFRFTRQKSTRSPVKVSIDTVPVLLSIESQSPRFESLCTSRRVGNEAVFLSGPLDFLLCLKRFRLPLLCFPEADHQNWW